MFASCATESTTTVTLFTAGLSVGASFGVAGSAVESDDEKGEKDPNYDELDDVEGFAEPVVARSSRPVEGCVVSWGSWRAVEEVEWCF